MKLLTRRSTSGREQSHRSVWGVISGAFFVVSLIFSSAAIWYGLLFDIDNMALSEAAEDLLAVSKLLIVAGSCSMAAVVFYLIGAYKQVKSSSEEAEEQPEKPPLTLIQSITQE